MAMRFSQRRRQEAARTPTLDEAREAWHEAYHAAGDIARAAEELPADHMDDDGIRKFSMLIMAKLLAAQSHIHMVCAAGIAAPTREVPE